MPILMKLVDDMEGTPVSSAWQMARASGILDLLRLPPRSTARKHVANQHEQCP